MRGGFDQHGPHVLFTRDFKRTPRWPRYNFQSEDFPMNRDTRTSRHFTAGSRYWRGDVEFHHSHPADETWAPRLAVQTTPKGVRDLQRGIDLLSNELRDAA